MRRSGPLILIVIVGILAFLGSSWFTRRADQHRTAPHIPRVLPPGTESTAQEWSYHQMAGDKPKAEIHAKDFREISAPNKFELEGVELDLYNKEGTTFNKVESAKAEFDESSSTMYSDGAVSITLGVPVNKAPAGQLMVITSSGVHFETKTGKAWTDRAAAFKYQMGEGTAVGASYDPQSGELLLRSQADLLWRGKNSSAAPMHIEAGQVTYKERESKVYLGPWAKLTRDTLSMNGGAAVVTIDKDHIRTVDAASAVGIDNQPERRLDYAADHLVMDFNEKGQVSHVLGEKNARLISTATSGQTKVTGDRVDLAFAAGAKSSTLQNAVATGHTVVESHPAPPPNGGEPAEERVLKSDVVRAAMRPDGNEIDSVETGAPGTLEFIPVRAGQPYRILHGSQMWMRYGAGNQIESFRSVNVNTRTDRPKQPNAKTPPPPALTWSRELIATFDPKTAQVARIEQNHDFRYEEGDRHATAEKAVMDQTRNVATLTGSAHMSDKTGTTSAKQIVIDQNSGDFIADGNVNSTRKSDNNMLSSDEPVHARARHMTTTEDKTLIRYEGDAVAWQGSDRIQADVIEIDRDGGKLTAHGHVISQLQDKKRDSGQPAAKDGKKSSPAFTVVRAPELIYTDEDRVAYYSGGVVLERPDMTVKSRELRAFLRPAASATDKAGNAPAPVQQVADTGRTAGPAAPDAKQNDSSSLDHAFADGKVEIVWNSAARRRVGHSEHAEYYVEEGKVVLSGGEPEFSDSLKGNTHGRQLTWFSATNRLIVSGGEAEQAHSLIQRK